MVKDSCEPRLYHTTCSLTSLKKRNKETAFGKSTGTYADEHPAGKHKTAIYTITTTAV